MAGLEVLRILAEEGIHRFMNWLSSPDQRGGSDVIAQLWARQFCG